MTRRRTLTTSLGAGAALVLAVVALTTSPSAGQDPGGACAVVDPLAAYAGSPDQDPPGTDLDRRFAFGYFNTQLTSPPDNVDSDADGSPDQVDNPSTDLGITSGRGTVRFSHDGQVLWAGGVGDIDGVPGDEIGVWAVGPGGGVRGIYTEVTDTWIVPGATPPGAVDPAVVGTAVEPGIPSSTVDRDGDGVPDVIVVDYTAEGLLDGASSVLSGAAVVAAGPGATAPSSAVVLALPGVVIGFARLDAAPDDLEGTDSVYRRDGDVVTLSVAEDTVTLRLARGDGYSAYPAPLDPPADLPPGASPVVFAYQGTDGDHLTFSYNAAGTGEPRTILWEVVVCGAAQPVPPAEEPGPAGPATAGPAVPVSGAARFTG